ncbi:MULTISPECIES: PilZ domain-containing protein [Thiomicrorhabdus]|uniref:PilZ domain-containing protein n=1 Tax=Thiomicrorhabdus heinhorstiae TaxID=2748010 RepID=A0ABS0C0M8_9GAMM|nr:MULTISPECIES: PilZ domain-containing protein [Thiomicrorhabdus]MBF6057796.1 PilZ domain-containing protein [Thiomicrorhabdus heinhorstiae]
MKKWFQKNNSRRFHRVDMPVRYFIRPSSPIENRQIYATGTDYFPPSIEFKVNRHTQLVKMMLNELPENSLIQTLLTEMFQSVLFFGKCLDSISHGIQPLQDFGMRVHLQQMTDGFPHLDNIKPHSPKTYSFLKQFEDKYLYIIKQFLHNLSESSQNYFAATKLKQSGFEIDSSMDDFRSPEHEQIPLRQAMLGIYDLFETYLEIYQHICSDHLDTQNPDNWPLQVVNISATGMAFHSSKGFPLHAAVDVFLAFDPPNKVIKFNGKVVSNTPQKNGHPERFAINFEFPDSEPQKYLQNEIQKFEIESCMDVEL